jgi:NodT family efflux transporter outer membrane factor (OMF) lipoprotein
MRNLLTICWIMAAIGAAGCAVGPDYHTPKVPVSRAFDPGHGYAATQPATRPAQPEQWWTSLADQELNSLVDRATKANLDLGIAIARLGEARSQRYVVAADWWPGVALSGAAGKSSGTNATRGRVDAPLNAASNTRNLRTITMLGGFDATWEIDLFGRVTRAVQAADADSQAFAEARNQVLVTLVADVVRAYTHLRSTQRRLEIARQYVDLEQHTLDLVRRKLSMGLTTEVDLALAEREIESARAMIPPLVAETAVSQRQIAVLLGGDPQALYAELDRSTPLLAVPTVASLGEPSALLRRRPDIRQAERQLASATALIGAATADLFPRVSLSGGFGLQYEGSWFSPTDVRNIYSWGPSVRWPLLDFGRLEAVLQVQDWRTRQMLLHYRKTIELAVQEVDDSLGRFAAEQERLQRLQKATVASDRAARLTALRYQRGLTDFLNVLDAQRQLFSLEDQAAVSQEAVVVNWASLNKALGRGWETIAPGLEPPSKPPGISPPLELITTGVAGAHKSQ